MQCSRALFCARPGTFRAPHVRGGDVLTDEDFQLALYCCYELHLSGVRRRERRLGMASPVSCSSAAGWSGRSKSVCAWRSQARAAWRPQICLMPCGN